MHNGATRANRLRAPASVRIAVFYGAMLDSRSAAALDRERYVLLVVDDYTRYTTVFPLRGRSEVPDDLIPWIHAVRLQLREWFREDLPNLRLHSDRGGEFSSELLQEFCRGEGILQSFMVPASLQQNGVAEHHIGLVMEVARTSMIHSAAPHFMWPFAVQYVAHQLNLWPRVSLPETSPTLCWMGKVGMRWCSGSGALFYHPAARRVLTSQYITFDESVPFYRLFLCRTSPLPPPPSLFLAPGPPPVDSLPPQGLAPSGVSQVDPLPLAEPYEVSVESGAAGGGAARSVASGGAEPAGVEPGGAKPTSVEPGGAELEGVEPGGAESEGAESRGAEPRGTGSPGGTAGASPRQSRRREPLSPRQLRECFSRRTRLRSGAAGARGPAVGGTGAGGVGATSPGCAGFTAGAGGTGGAGAAGPGGARTRGTGAARGAGIGGDGAGGAGAGGTGAGGAGAVGAGAGGAKARGAGARDPGAGGVGAGDPRAGGVGAGGAGAGGTGAGGIVKRRPFFVTPPPSSLPPPGSVLRQLQPHSPLPAPSPYAKQRDSLTERREPASCPALLVRAVHTGRRVPRPHPPRVPGTHIMAPRPSSVPLPVPVPSPPASSLADGLEPESDLVLAELVDFAVACRLDYAASHVAESGSDYPPSVEDECALGTDVLEDKQEDFECLAAALPHLVAMLLAPDGDPDALDIPTPCSYVEAITGPYSSQWQPAMDVEMVSWKSTGTYMDAVPPPGANIVDGMWIFRVKRPSGSPPIFKGRYIARGFSQGEGVDFF
ncbi:unnamed protein product [Closterium sp. NIES-53]